MSSSTFKSVVIVCFCLCLQLVTVENANSNSSEALTSKESIFNDPDLNKNVSELIASKGYPVEEHTVVTKDGYILSIQRIPQKKKTEDTKVILLWHGIMSAGHDWVCNFPDQSLGFIASDAGYDVWLGNTRGNTYSKRHKIFDTSSMAFWDFCVDDIALYDVPATIDYILEKTGQKQLQYVGHSMGTTIMFALLSTYKEYNEKVKTMIALAPVAFNEGQTGGLKHLQLIAELTEREFGSYEFLPNSDLLKTFARLYCPTTELMDRCLNIYFLVVGPESSQVNKTRFPVYSQLMPAGTSSKTMAQYAQFSPPIWQLENIKTPIALCWSQNDKLADPGGVQALSKKLKSLVAMYKVPYEDWSHIDFTIAVEAKKYINLEVLDLLKKH